MRRRGLAGRHGLTWIVALACGLILILSSAASASASDADGGSFGPSQPAPCLDGAECRPPCVVGFSTSCESRDPKAAIKFPAQYGCSYQGTVDWGDGTHQSVSFSGTKLDTSNYTDLTHTYQSTQVFQATMPLTETCADDSVPDTFTEQYSFAIMTGHYSVVALGDSYSSGEGAKSYDPGTQGKCDRSRFAWPRLLPDYSAKAMRPVDDIACSGATSNGLYGKQKSSSFQEDQLGELRARDPSLVTLTIGGNDIHFADVLKDCYLFVTRAKNCVTDGRIEKLDRDIHGEIKLLTDDYIAIARAAPHARVLVIGYPQLFPGPRDLAALAKCKYLSYGGRALPLNYVERIKIYTEDVGLRLANVLLDSVIDDAVAVANVRLLRHQVYNRIAYASAYESLSLNEMCSKDSGIVNVGDIFRGNAQGHPNVAGQKAIAKAVSRYINQYL